MFPGILGGTSEHWNSIACLWGCMAKSGHSVDAADLAVAVHGFVGDNDREAKKTYLEHEIKMFQTGSAECYCNCSILLRNYLIINYFQIQNVPFIDSQPVY